MCPPTYVPVLPMPAATKLPPALSRFYDSIPDAPGVDVAQIRGNAPASAKRVNANLLAYFTSGSGPGSKIDAPFAKAVGGQLRLAQVDVFRDVFEDGENVRCRVVVEVEVSENMCNLYGTMHGGCAAYVVDNVTLSATIGLGLSQDFDGTGVSQSMNIRWFAPAHLGSAIQITAEAVYADKRLRLAQAEIRKKKTGQLLVSGDHALLNAGPSSKL
ncbi:unnamed protein product [Mycena citricolor]|uniref:Thioesterase domain-containing protein n=1 Tax=Mycena citricolor TaxID=2018698 RepID=A0AAD2HGH5_9AGAR|nr:unnamed protein product [Mycena citricolor]